MITKTLTHDQKRILNECSDYLIKFPNSGGLNLELNCFHELLEVVQDLDYKVAELEDKVNNLDKDLLATKSCADDAESERDDLQDKIDKAVALLTD